MKKLIFFLLILQQGFLPVFSQNTVDSLKRVLEKSKVKSSVYNKLSAVHKDSVQDDALAYSRRALEFATTEKNEREKAVALGSIGAYHLNNYQYDSALFYLHKSRRVWENLKNENELASVFNLIAVTLYYKGETDSVMGYWTKSAEYDQKSMNTKGLAVTYNNMGALSMHLGNLAEALINFQKSLEIKKELGDKKGLAYAYNNIGQIHDEWGEFHKSMEVYQLALDLSTEIGDRYMQSVVLNNMASNFKMWKELGKALEYYKKSLEIKREIDDKKGTANLLNNTASVYEEMQQLDDAMEMYIEAQKVYESIGDKSGLSASYNNIGSIFRKQNKPLFAIPLHKKSLELSQEIKSNRGILTAYHSLAKDYMSLADYQNAKIYLIKTIETDVSKKYPELKIAALQDLTDVYKATGNFAKALESLSSYSNLKDSIFSDKKLKQITQLQALYETEKKDKEIELQQLNLSLKEAALNRERTIRYSVVVALIVTFAFLGGLIFLYFQKQSAYKVLLKQNLEIIQKERMILSLHESRTEPPCSKPQKYTTSLLTDEQKDELLERVNCYMVESRSYLNPSYTIEDMAVEMGTNRRYLSQVINEKFGVNFNSFINELRIKEARRMLVDPKYYNLSLQGIAESVGFLSRASFNDAFKKFTGLTPSYFMKLKVTA